MYQALYRTWRPRTFDDVVGQSHITDTLTQQVETNRLSHAYLFTGTRGTGKTSCAKILSRAVNCEAPVNGNPCNACPACLGIESGSILDVLELDAASNNGVDQVRALRDEAIYTPAAVRRRVYIIDEVHMLSTPAFNALLKILEEPPEHLLFILATTELHKVPATIRSRCQQFAFKRIQPHHIAGRLTHIAQAENIPLTDQGATLIARLSDGGLRDALSLLDQCAIGNQTVDEGQILDILGLAGNLETANLLTQIANRDTASVLETFSRLYQGGKDVATLFGELSTLCRDLLLQHTAPKNSGLLLTGGYDQATMAGLLSCLPPQRLLYMLKLLQEASVALNRSTNRRTDGELCLLQMTDESLDDSPAALSARIAQLEQNLAQGVPQRVTPPVVATPPAPVFAPPAVQKPVAQAPVERYDEAPPWGDDDMPPLPEEPPLSPYEQDYLPAPKPVAPPPPPRPVAPPPPPKPAPVAKPTPAPQTTPPVTGGATGDSGFWSNFAASLRGTRVPASVMPYFTNPEKVTGVLQNGVLTLWVPNSFTKSMLDKPAITEPLAGVTAERVGSPVRIAFQVGKAPAVTAAPVTAPPVQVAPPPAPPAEVPPQEDALNELLAFGEQFDNITIN